MRGFGMPLWCTVALVVVSAVLVVVNVGRVASAMAGYELDADCPRCGRQLAPYRARKRSWFQKRTGGKTVPPWLTIAVTWGLSWFVPKAGMLTPKRWWCRRCDNDAWVSPAGLSLKAIVVGTVLTVGGSIALVGQLLGVLTITP